MIPLVLSLKNFMCYRENVPPLSFEGIHLACLCGDNGNGKSAIFDAITWALWGKARTNTSDQLIHTSQSEMEVELVFLIQGQRYRIIRKYGRKPGSGTGRISLELQIKDDDGYKSISGNTVTETQAKISELLHLDYDTFINSAFLRQGHSNEFSIKEPAKRKDVLSNILGMYQYDLIRDLAQRHVEDKKREAVNIENVIQDIFRQLASREQYINESVTIKAQLNSISVSKKEIEDRLKGLREQKSLLDKKMEQLSGIRAQLIKDRKELDDWNEKYKKSSRKVEELNKILENRENIESGYLNYTTARKQNEELNIKLRKLVELKSRLSELTEIINKEYQSLSFEVQKLKETVRAEETRSSQSEVLQKELDAATAGLKTIIDREASIENKKEGANKLVQTLSDFQAQLKRFDAQIDEDSEKIKLLGYADSRCPLCGKSLDNEERKNLNTKLKDSVENIKRERVSVSQELMLKNKKLIEIRKEISSEESGLRNEREKFQTLIAVNKRKLEEAREAAKNSINANSKLEQIELRLEKKDYAEEAQLKMKSIQSEIESTGYDKSVHEKTGNELKSLEKYEGLKRELDTASAQVITEQSFVNDNRDVIDRINNSINNAVENSRMLSDDIENYSGCVKLLEDAEKEYRNIQSEESNMLSAQAVKRERIKMLDDLEIRNRENQEALKKLRFEEQVNRELAEAFSKKGVQALLIKEAFPEIELEANRLLGKMTDNRLSLKLESQKELKSRKGEVAETLDIIISDELGTRDYEMFSGGEAFRIDLALRIALSKLLVKRAGASMPILIIDEGFGTQDSSGRERLVEAIKSIEDDFEKIFVITHMEEVKESFPVAINVYKTPEGSMVSIG
jgi:exonuclease SbcC